MVVESLVGLTFTEAEVKEALIMMLDCERNSLLHSDVKHQRLSRLIEHAQNNHTCLDVVDGAFNLMIDGVCEKESFSLDTDT